MFISQDQVQHGTVLRAFQSHSPPEGPEPPEPVTGKPPRPTAGAAVSMTLPFQSDMGNKRSWQLGGLQLQDRSSVWDQNKRELGERRGENWSREESKLSEWSGLWLFLYGRVKGRENYKYTVQRWNIFQGTGWSSQKAFSGLSNRATFLAPIDGMHY